MDAQDKVYMRQALALAREAGERGEVPVGAVVVDPVGVVIGTGKNEVEARFFQGAHAEARAIQAAGEQGRNWRLDGCTIYVTLEPCMMCISLIALARIERVVYGATSPYFGFTLDREGVLNLYTKQIKCITAGVCADEASGLLQEGFSKARGSG